MDVDYKSYTFKSESSNQFSSFKAAGNRQPYSSPTFKTSQRAESLPTKQNYKASKDSQKLDSLLEDSKRRKAKLCGEDKRHTQQESLSTYKKKRRSIFGKYDRAQQQLGAKKETLQITKQDLTESFADSIKSPFECKQLIQKKLAERANASVFSSSLQIKQTMALKERQIRFLKLQIQRFKRCETINNENQDLYRKLTQKLKDRTNEALLSSIKKEQILVDTPIQSLKQIRFSYGPSQPPTRSPAPAAKLSTNEPFNTAPLKTIPENEENHLYTESKTQAPLKDQQGEEFKTVSRGKAHRNRSPPGLFHFQRETDPIYVEIRQKMNEHQSGLKRDINQIPLNFRLQVMNRTLEGSFNDHVRRAYSRPHSQSSQKTKRLQQSLKKSHYYIMMQ